MAKVTVLKANLTYGAKQKPTALVKPFEELLGVYHAGTVSLLGGEVTGDKLVVLYAYPDIKHIDWLLERVSAFQGKVYLVVPDPMMFMLVKLMPKPVHVITQFKHVAYTEKIFDRLGYPIIDVRYFPLEKLSLQLPPIQNNPTVDLIYTGYPRPGRGQKIKEYVALSEFGVTSRLVGTFHPSDFPGVEVLPPVSYPAALEAMATASSSIVIVEPSYLDLGIVPPRFYEACRAGNIPFVEEQLRPILGEPIDDWLFVRSPAELASKVVQVRDMSPSDRASLVQVKHDRETYRDTFLRTLDL